MNEVIFILTVFFLCCQRIFELWLARDNEKWMRQNQAIEFGREYYAWIVALHAGFILSLTLEGWLRGPQLISSWPTVITLLGLLQLLRYWCIISLGKFWNTKILIIPGAKRINAGPYRWVRHPNYIVVVLELLLWPLLFSCWITLLWTGLANGLVLRMRLRQENEALSQLA
jgi:methyltransferase